ncbi:hypothetical protein D3C72_1636010 [compost metagenome]
MQQLQRVHLDFQAWLEHADHGGGATPGEHGERLFSSLLEADAFERVMDTITGQFQHLFGSITALGVDHIRGAKLASQFQFAVEHVDGNDSPCSGQRRAVDGSQANTATANDRDGFPRTHLGGIEHRAGTGGDRTAQQRGAVQRHVAAYRHAGVLMHQHLFGKAGQVDELRDRFLHVGQPRFFIGCALGFG